MSEYAHNFPNVTEVGYGAFANATFSGPVNLQSLTSLPNAIDCPERIEKGADHVYGVFEGSNFENGNFSSTIYIGSRAFYGCPIHNANAAFSKVQIIGEQAFAGASFIRNSDWPPETYDFSSTISVGQSAFQDAGAYTITNRILLNMPNVQTIGYRGFSGAYAYPGRYDNGEIIVDLPNCTFIGERGLQDESATAGHTKGISKAYLKSLTSLEYLVFRWTGITELHVGPNCSIFKSACLYGTLADLSLYIYTNTVPTLEDYLDSGLPHGIPPHIYVRRSLVESYKNNATWGYYSDAISALEDAPNPQDW